MRTWVEIETAHEVEGVVPAGIPSVEERLACSRVWCQRTGTERSGSDCMWCEHFRGWRDGPGLQHVTVTCAFEETAETPRACLSCGDPEIASSGAHQGLDYCVRCAEVLAAFDDDEGAEGD